MAKGKKDPPPPPRPWTPDLESDLNRILEVGEECISASELRGLILAKGRGAEKYADDDAEHETDLTPRIRLYDGFEPSGRMHIAQGLLKSVNVNRCTLPGTHSTFCFWVADWFALMNDKMGGDLEKIMIVGRYLIEVWKAAGMDLTHVEFRWASEEITEKAHVYWPLMLDVARRFNVTRIKKCCQIMGRLEGGLTAAQVLYPLMQCADVFFLKADICQLGVDQRKVNMLAREYCDASKKKFKPVILSHHMLYGLKEGQEKMSKSDPDSAIFMEDTSEDVERKIGKAYCPTAVKVKEGEEGANSGGAAATTEDAGKESMHLTTDELKNPILDYVRHIVLSPPDATFTCATSTEDAKTYSDYNAVEEDFLKGDIAPEQLKKGLTDALNELLQPVRDHFANDETAKGLLEQVREFKRQTSAPSDAKEGAPKAVRLDLVKEGAVPASCHLVVAPLPTSNPTLQSAADLLAKLEMAPDKGAPKVLMLPDWTARVNNALDADPKLITAYHSLLLASLRALDSYLHGDEGVMKDVTIITQSEAILKDPSNYWISVINAGRHFALDEVMGMGIAGLGEEAGMKDSECVGKVIGRLMLIADVLAVNPKSIALDAVDTESAKGSATAEDEDVAQGVDGMSLDTRPQSVEDHLIRQFYANKLSHPKLSSVLPLPEIAHLSPSSGPKLALQPPRESAAHRTEFDEYFLADDPKVHGKSKMKKAFCEPGNVEFCPPIELLVYLGGLDSDGTNSGNEKKVTVSRSPENGGDVSYSTKASLIADFESGSLHPGDLKGVASKILVEVLTKVSAEIKGDADAAKGVKALKAFEKKMAKQKKK
mmetsp:Transcript_22161/g.53682  ORF Transcript_22161/g.53682 Transcript_22161/m.53682 type:complete len:825 (+) Transcript_22161:180-2654(+)|eukprot:CAMPEP_0181114034 /NCGR_PEP_ID=MMETSP1071-20121207/20662_1 /TAXON_ID=35127 /ORGANISM="Thalassiosira sp., Strain NH16" /LENGTH=824 /DNA_ID=CAMNT_0023198105 /DNA_START=87 /DNA_END=2561 /DNA_ORIENTATION=-